MNKFLLIILLLGSRLILVAQSTPISKDTFLLRVQQSFTGPVNVLLLDSLAGSEVDSLYNLPRPLYKAQVIRTNADKENIFLYYYPEKDFDTVLQRTFPSVVKNTDKPKYITDLPLSDQATKTFLVYFFPSTWDSSQEDKLYKSIVASFKLSLDSVQLVEITQEEHDRLVPSPPPPKPGIKKIKKPHKKSPA